MSPQIELEISVVPVTLLRAMRDLGVSLQKTALALDEAQNRHNETLTAAVSLYEQVADYAHDAEGWRHAAEEAKAKLQELAGKGAGSPGAGTQGSAPLAGNPAGSTEAGPSGPLGAGDAGPLHDASECTRGRDCPYHG